MLPTENRWFLISKREALTDFKLIYAFRSLIDAFDLYSFSCHISKILNCLKIHTFHDLYIKTKLAFIRTLCFNEISQNIFLYLSETKECSLRSKSFRKDIALLKDQYKKDILVICKNAQNLGMEFVKKFQATDEITDSIRTCLENYKDKTYIEILLN